MEVESKTVQPAGWIQAILVGRNPKRTLIRLIVLIVGSVVVFGYLFLPIRVSGISMAPTYKDGRVNFVNRLAFTFHEPRRGDVVSIRYSGRSIMLLKRIVGMPGETIAFVNGWLYVDGKPMKEPYVIYPCNWNMPETTLKAGEFFVVGDNRSMNLDDHDHGVATRDRIVGRVLL